VKWLTGTWLVVRDILLTSTGLWIIFRQAGSRHPSDALLAVALTLTAPAVGAHVRALLSSPGESRSSSSPPSPSLPPSSSPQEAPGE